jgi:murein DD-endopeptidase MepM/ murein hydrolase activator NlpD
VLVGLALQLPGPARAEAVGTRAWLWPLSPTPTVVARFQAPERQWGPGHRGIDLLGSVGEQVLAVADGTIAFAGMVAGRGVVVVDHGQLRSTYEPVTPRVMRGDHVGAGQVIATLSSVQSHCPPDACLHLGVRRGDVYLDPLSLLGAQQVRLKPLSGLKPAGRTSNAGSGGAAGIGPSNDPYRDVPQPSARSAPSAVELTVSTGGGAAAGLTALSLVRRRRRRVVRRVTSPP